MKMKFLTAVSAALLAVALVGGSAEAKGCRSKGTCQTTQTVKKHRIKKHYRISNGKVVRRLSGKRVRSTAAFAVRGGVPRGRGHVVAMIKSMAPRYGVPTWFALRIAHVESGYNPRVRGAAGEYGVFQMKCATARGLGFRGGCGQLLNASTNVQFGLKHLQAAVRSSRGNLKMAASKHNGGLGRKTIVRGYVSKVF